MNVNQRPIPQEALDDPNAVEMARIWIANKKLVCSLKVGMYRETTKIGEDRAWGIILADLARHVSNALEEGYGLDARQALEAIAESFAKEIDRPTSSARGKFLQKN